MKTVNIYTDGACSGNPGKGGYGVVIIYKNHRKELSGGYELTTNNRMEIMAVIKGLEVLKENCKVTIFSDSKYVVDAIEKGWLKKWEKNNWIRNKKEEVLNKDLWLKIKYLINLHDVKFVWVKGHADVEENERCDFLATEYVKNGSLEIDSCYIN